MSWPFKHLMGQEGSLGPANLSDSNNISNSSDSNKAGDANNNNNHSESLLARKQQEFSIHRLLQQQHQQLYNHLDESGQQLLGSATKPMEPTANLLAIDHMLPAADQLQWAMATAATSTTELAHLPALYSSFGPNNTVMGGYHHHQQQQQVEAPDGKPADAIDRFGEAERGRPSSSSGSRFASHHQTQQDDPIGSGRNLGYHQQQAGANRSQLAGDAFANGDNQHHHQRLAMYHRHQAANEFLAIAAAAAAAQQQQHHQHQHHQASYHTNAYQSSYHQTPMANGRGGAGLSSASTSFPHQQQQPRQAFGAGGLANGPAKRRNKLPFFTGPNLPPSGVGADNSGAKDIYGQPLNSAGESSERFSRKVFVGGLPPDIDEEEIKASFRRFGSLLVDWPHKAESKSYFPPKGYAFLLFHEEASVQALIDACLQEEDKLYLCVSSPTIKDKPVQIRPWRLSDADFVLDSTLALDPRKTVFVGGVPRPLKASELAKIMNNLYGGVCYAGIDTDPELKYPKGAGRVAFSNHQSYIAAISARFVHLQHSELEKRVEVKPYVLDDQFCDECQGARCANKFAPFFCANITCLQYYCETCWSAIHSQPDRAFHKPLVKEGAERPRNLPGSNGGGGYRWC